MAKISRREFGRLTAGGVTAAIALPLMGPRVAPQRTRSRPNVLFVLMDDMRWDHMGCAGHPVIRTPALDRLAREGARFSNAFVTLSLCSPSRASFLTGLYAQIHGVLGNRTPLDFSRLTTFPQRFQRTGYRTAMFGKWHMGVDMDPKPGFDHWACFRGQGSYFNPTLNINGEVTTREGFTDDVTSGLAAEWMNAQDPRPFLAIVGFKSCHSPFEPPPRTAALYEGTQMPRPPSFDRPLPDQPQWIQQFDDAGHTPYSRIPFDELALRFARLVTAADENVGRMISALESAGRLDQTLVIFSSDNGFLLHEHGLYDKRAMYEESIRIPLLMRYPALVKRGVIDDVTLNIDLAPTLLQMIGVAGAEDTQGMSLLPAMQGRRRNKRSVFFYRYDRETPYSTPSLMGVRTPEWKLVRYQEEGQLHELYNVKKDPFEMKNLFESPRSRKARDRLDRELARLAPLAKVPRPIR
ncbi:MAG TPA: sulfatase [Vicinamibacterales bacterium]|nr:sulfatase [Vicinamibacterales bacterium]